MRKTEYLDKGVEALLAQTKCTPVLLTYRGVNEKLEDVFEAKAVTEVDAIKGIVLVQMATEKDLLEGLVARQPKKED